MPHPGWAHTCVVELLMRAGTSITPSSSSPFASWSSSVPMSTLLAYTSPRRGLPVHLGGINSKNLLGDAKTL
eukprot:230382-Chlamydomonas_euryale.AAC.1